MRKSCFLFGHRDAPGELIKKIQAAVIDIHLKTGICDFVVGNHGKFDLIAQRAIDSSKFLYPNIRLCLLTAHHLNERKILTRVNCDEILYPEILTSTPPKWAIVKANHFMIRTVAAFIMYLNHPGNARASQEMALNRARREEIPFINLSKADIQSDSNMI